MGKGIKIYKNGVIYTVTGEKWEDNPAEAMVVDEHGNIIAIGSNKIIEDFEIDDADISDINGNVVLPGFVDSHVHAPGKALSELFEINLFGLTEKDETIAAIKAYIDAHPEMDAYWGSGFNFGMTGDNGESACAAWLDEICPDKEISIRSYDLHSRWVNSCLMKNRGINRETVTKGIGNIHRDKDGNPTGLFTDVRDIGLPDPEYSHEQVLQAFERFVLTMNNWGYTSITSIMPLPAGKYSDYNLLSDAGKLTLRVNGSGFIKPCTAEQDLENLKKLKAETESDILKIRTAKFMIDGVLEGFTAYLNEPYSIEVGKGEQYYGKPEWEKDALEEIFSKVIKEGFQVHCHTIGDAAVHMTLDAIESALQESDGTDTRNVLTHLEVVDKEDIPRFGKLGIISAIQTFWHFKEPGFFEPVEVKAIGRDRAEHIYPAKSFIKAGGRITNSGDFPVSSVNNPFWGIEAGVTRNVYNEEYYGVKIDGPDDERYLLNPDERLTVAEMIEAYTINGAYQMFREDEFGSLEKGKKADFIVIDKDPFKIKTTEIHTIKILSVYFNGERI